MICKFCGLDGLHWGENWKKGDRPLEPDTNIMHTSDRCNDVQSRNIIKKTGWIHRICNRCNLNVYFSRKRFNEKTAPATCHDCLIYKRGLT